jgi:hypothetical protein
VSVTEERRKLDAEHACPVPPTPAPGSHPVWGRWASGPPPVRVVTDERTAPIRHRLSDWEPDVGAAPRLRVGGGVAFHNHPQVAVAGVAAAATTAVLVATPTVMTFAGISFQASTEARHLT